MARIAIKIPSAAFEFEAVGSEESVAKWCDDVLKARFKEDFRLSPGERAVDRAFELAQSRYETKEEK